MTDTDTRSDDDRTDADTERERPSVLVPLAVLEGEVLPDGVPELLATTHVVLLGYHEIPDQTAPGQARMQFEERALAKLDDVQAVLEGAGATVERRLVFTHRPQQTFDRQIAEHGCDAVFVPGSVGELDEVLVAIRGEVGLDRITNFVAGLVGGTDLGVILYHLRGPDETEEHAAALLEVASDHLVDHGVPPGAIERRIDSADEIKPVDAIAGLADDCDAVVMGETDPSVATYVFGMPSKQVADRFLGPVLVVQREPEAPEEEPGTEEGEVGAGDGDVGTEEEKPGPEEGDEASTNPEEEP